MARDVENEGDYYKSHGGIIPVKWTAPEVSLTCSCVYQTHDSLYTSYITDSNSCLPGRQIDITSILQSVV